MGELANYTIDQVAGALALTLGSIGGLCLILFKSRCETISICWGAWACNRKVQEEIIPKQIQPLQQTDSIGRPLPQPQPEPQP